MSDTAPTQHAPAFHEAPTPDAPGDSRGTGSPGHASATAPQTLRAALRYFEQRLQAQEAQLARHRLAQQQVDASRHHPGPHGRATGGAGLPSGSGSAGAPMPPRWRPPGRLARELRRIGRRLRRVLPRAWRGVIFPAPAPAVDPDDYRVRLRALRDSGQLAHMRRIVLIAPRRLSRAAAAVAGLLEGMSLTCSVRSAMPDTFADDLYIVLSPALFATLPPPDRRILWLVEPEDLGADDTGADQARLSDSLCVFEAIQPRIAELQARGLVQHQIFHVPLPPVSTSRPVRDDRSPMGLPHLLARALHGCGVLDDAAFEAATLATRLDGRAVVLCLPEAPERFAHACAGAREGAQLFPGLRHVDGWKGAALSYRYLARRALEAQRERLIVWEDDARLPEDFDVRLPALLAQLEARAGAWDLFSGLITDLSPQGRVTSVQPYGDDLLIEIDTVVGMVFGVYGPRALQAMATYRIEGEDVMKNTIDRYLEALDLRCCTLFPPLVGHADHLSSSLWDQTGRRFLRNDAFDPMILRSQLRLLAKMADALEDPSRSTPPGRD